MKKSLLILLTLLVTVTLTACGGTTEEEWGAASTIQIYTRDTSSGTRAGFMGGIDFDEAENDDSVLANGFVIKDNTGILTSMATDEYGIGYVSLASLDDTVKALSFDGVTPNITNVINNTYGLKRPFNYVTRALDDFANDTEKEITLAFIAFLSTSDGSDIITNKGAVPLVTSDTWDDIASQYSICDADNTGVVIKFGGSDSIQKIAEALTADFAPRCGNFTPEHDHTGSSDGFKRTQGSEKDGDNYKHVGFASRPFKDTEAGSTGTQGQLAWDAIIAIVHVNNKLDSITALELMKIFSGEHTTWNELIN